jgi:hypothetical protein
VFWLFRVALIGIGYIVVPIAVIFGAYSMKPRMLAGKSVDMGYFTWKWMWLWGNDEEGIAWYDTMNISFFGWFEVTIKFKALPLKIIYSSCKRNPVNNLRYVPWLSVKIDPAKVRYVAKPKFEDLKLYDSDKLNFKYYAWQGIYSCYRSHFQVFGYRFRFWLGWKFYVDDVNGVFDHRKESAGFASQLKGID